LETTHRRSTANAGAVPPAHRPVRVGLENRRRGGGACAGSSRNCGRGVYRKRADAAGARSLRAEHARTITHLWLFQVGPGLGGFTADAPPPRRTAALTARTSGQNRTTFWPWPCTDRKSTDHPSSSKRATPTRRSQLGPPHAHPWSVGRRPDLMTVFWVGPEDTSKLVGGVRPARRRPRPDLTNFDSLAKTGASTAASRRARRRTPHRTPIPQNRKVGAEDADVRPLYLRTPPNSDGPADWVKTAEEAAASCAAPCRPPPGTLAHRSQAPKSARTPPPIAFWGGNHSHHLRTTTKCAKTRAFGRSDARRSRPHRAERAAAF
jgi:hypothetical protein